MVVVIVVLVGIVLLLALGMFIAVAVAGLKGLSDITRVMGKVPGLSAFNGRWSDEAQRLAAGPAASGRRATEEKAEVTTAAQPKAPGRL